VSQNQFGRDRATSSWASLGKLKQIWASLNKFGHVWAS